MYRKLIYSYPTSTNAQKLGRWNSGCYAVSMTDKTTKETGKLYGPYDTLADGRKAMSEIFPDLPTDPYSFGEPKRLPR